MKQSRRRILGVVIGLLLVAGLLACVGFTCFRWKRIKAVWIVRRTPIVTSSEFPWKSRLAALNELREIGAESIPPLLELWHTEELIWREMSDSKRSDEIRLGMSETSDCLADICKKEPDAGTGYLYTGLKDPVLACPILIIAGQFERKPERIAKHVSPLLAELTAKSRQNPPGEFYIMLTCLQSIAGERLPEELRVEDNSMVQALLRWQAEPAYRTGILQFWKEMAESGSED